METQRKINGNKGMNGDKLKINKYMENKWMTHELKINKK